METGALRDDLFSPKSKFFSLYLLLELFHLSLLRDPRIFEGPWTRPVNTELLVSLVELQLLLWLSVQAQETTSPFWTR